MEKNKRPFFIIIPGSGKGTQCSNIAHHHFGFPHLSAGELLQTEVNTGPETGQMIQQFKGKESYYHPRLLSSFCNRQCSKVQTPNSLLMVFCAIKKIVSLLRMLGIQPTLVLVFDCSEKEMISCVLNRKQGRVDDNIDTIRKRLKVYKESTLFVIDHYATEGKVRKINAERPIEEVFRNYDTGSSSVYLQFQTPALLRSFMVKAFLQMIHGQSVEYSRKETLWRKGLFRNLGYPHYQKLLQSVTCLIKAQTSWVLTLVQRINHAQQKQQVQHYKYATTTYRFLLPPLQVSPPLNNASRLLIQRSLECLRSQLPSQTSRTT